MTLENCNFLNPCCWIIAFLNMGYGEADGSLNVECQLVLSLYLILYNFSKRDPVVEALSMGEP